MQGGEGPGDNLTGKLNFHNSSPEWQTSAGVDARSAEERNRHMERRDESYIEKIGSNNLSTTFRRDFMSRRAKFN